MRRAQLALHLPHQIGELGSGGDATHQRPIAAIDALPIHVLHVLAPELIALQPPGVAIHLGPFGPGQHRQARPVQIQPATLTARRRSVLVVRLVASVQQAQPVAHAIDQRLGVHGNLKGGDAIHQGLQLLIAEIVCIQHAVGMRRGAGRPALVQAALDRPPREKHLAFDAAYLLVHAVVDRKGQDAILDPVQVDLDMVLLFLLVLFLLRPLSTASASSRRLSFEWSLGIGIGLHLGPTLALGRGLRPRPHPGRPHPGRLCPRRPSVCLVSLRVHVALGGRVTKDPCAG